MKSSAFTPVANQPLAPLTTVRLGGPAEWFARVESTAAVADALAWAGARRLPVTVLGGGSNVVINDAGLPGLVLQLGMSQYCAAEGPDGKVRVSAGAGAEWDPFVAHCVDNGWAGLECLSGIPGQVGATPIQNVGAYGQDVGQTLAEVEVFDRHSAQTLRLTGPQCGLGYRTSRFKTEDADRFIVLGVTFELGVEGAACLSYPELQQHFPERAQHPPTLRAVREVVLKTRRSKSMVLDTDDPNGRSCGSFFLNPSLSTTALKALRARAPEPPPAYAQPDGRWKVPAAWLIERAGVTRGLRSGNVGISSRHSLALICHQGATAAELSGFAHWVRDTVGKTFGVWLRAEPRFVGVTLGPGGLPLR